MIKLDLKEGPRPVFDIRHEKQIVSTLVDTGAYINVYTRSLILFLKKFPYAYDTGKVANIDGFGGKADKPSSVWCIPLIKIDEFLFRNVLVALQSKEGIGGRACTIVILFSFWKNNYRLHRQCIYSGYRVFKGSDGTYV